MLCCPSSSDGAHLLCSGLLRCVTARACRSRSVGRHECLAHGCPNATVRRFREQRRQSRHGGT
ncbi:uncharacterized protein B0H18DRAFT_1031488, partial [Fomitopsis serialis]|uniref:uncharacterized protein n=1 Tax=Fomitopsis serialis TaxID=139415 RepID=UPI002007EC87